MYNIPLSRTEVRDEHILPLSTFMNPGTSSLRAPSGNLEVDFKNSPRLSIQEAALSPREGGREGAIHQKVPKGRGLLIAQPHVQTARVEIVQPICREERVKDSTLLWMGKPLCDHGDSSTDPLCVCEVGTVGQICDSQPEGPRFNPRSSRGLNFGPPSFATPSVDRDVKPLV